MDDKHKHLRDVLVFAPGNINKAREDQDADRRNKSVADMILSSMDQHDGRDIEPK